MKNVIFAACGALAIAGTMTLSAQTPTSPPRPMTPPTTPEIPAPSSMASKTVTVTGCLKTWDSTMGTNPATTAAVPGERQMPAGAPSAARYVLTNVEGDSTMGAAKTDPKAEAKQYALMADSSVNLSAHVNHKVQVTGKTTAAADHAGMERNPTKPGAAVETTGMDKAWTTLTVSAVKMISTTCGS